MLFYLLHRTIEYRGSFKKPLNKETILAIRILNGVCYGCHADQTRKSWRNRL